jgi:hypothetical protein
MNIKIVLRFLDIILRVLRLEVFCIDILNHKEGGMVSYHVFLLSSLQCTVTELETLRGFVSLKK